MRATRVPLAAIITTSVRSALNIRNTVLNALKRRLVKNATLLYVFVRSDATKRQSCLEIKASKSRFIRAEVFRADLLRSRNVIAKSLP